MRKYLFLALKSKNQEAKMPRTKERIQRSQQPKKKFKKVK